MGEPGTIMINGHSIKMTPSDLLLYTEDSSPLNPHQEIRKASFSRGKLTWRSSTGP